MSSTRTAVGHVIKNYLPPTQNWIYEQFRALREYESVVLAYRAVHPEKFPVRELVAVRSGKPWQQARDFIADKVRGYYPSLARLARAQNVRVLHAHFGHTGAQSVPLARRLRLPLLASFYGVDLWRDRGDAQRLVRRYATLFEQCTFAIAEGPVARARLTELGCPAEKTRIHPLGIDLSRVGYHPRPQTPVVRVLAAARFTEKKGLTYGVEAFCRAAAEEPALLLTIVGDAAPLAAEREIKARLHSIVQANRMSARVRFTGNLPPQELRALLYEHDVMLQPSVRAADGDAEGGLPVILLEAAASGMPAIASRHCDIPEIVVEGQTGWLCAERDIAGLTEALIAAARDAKSRAAFGGNARRLVEQRFDLFQHTWDALYQEALSY